MRPGEGKAGGVVVKSGFFPVAGVVTLQTVERKILGEVIFRFVVILLVTTDTLLAGRCCVSEVTVGALAARVTIGQRKSGGYGMVELRRNPCCCVVASFTLNRNPGSSVARVQCLVVIVGVAGRTLRRSSGVA